MKKVVIAVVNGKGGTGKTETVFQIAKLLAPNVVVIDSDPQATLSRRLGAPLDADDLSPLGVYEYPGAPLPALVQGRFGIKVLPAGQQLQNVPVHLARFRGSRALRFMDAYVKTLDVPFVLIDCPPHFDHLTLNAMMAADSLLVPTAPEPADMNGLAALANVMGELMDDRGADRPWRTGVIATKVMQNTVRHTAGMLLLKYGFGVLGDVPASVADEFAAVQPFPQWPLLGAVRLTNGVDAEASRVRDYESIVAYAFERGEFRIAEGE